MADIKLEPQEAGHLSQDPPLPSFSPLQEHKSGVSLSTITVSRSHLLIDLYDVLLDPTSHQQHPP
jgi:hypothetical protein